MSRAHREESPDDPGSRRPWIWGLILVLVLTLAATATVVMYLHASAPPQFVGAAPMIPPIRARDFRLLDQADRPVTLASFRGKAVALTFLYTHCPHVCPVIAEKIREASTMLGTSAAQVAFVAVSVDPREDTPQAVRAFLAAHRVTHTLVYLTGSFQALRPVWAHYYIGTDAAEVNPAASAASAPSPDVVTHNSIVYVVDPRGQIRLFLSASFRPQDLATDLRLLVADVPR